MRRKINRKVKGLTPIDRKRSIFVWQTFKGLSGSLKTSLNGHGTPTFVIRSFTHDGKIGHQDDDHFYN